MYVCIRFDLVSFFLSKLTLPGLADVQASVQKYSRTWFAFRVVGRLLDNLELSRYRLIKPEQIHSQNVKWFHLFFTNNGKSNSKFIQ